MDTQKTAGATQEKEKGTETMVCTTCHHAHMEDDGTCKCGCEVNNMTNKKNNNQEEDKMDENK